MFFKFFFFFKFLFSVINSHFKDLTNIYIYYNCQIAVGQYKLQFDSYEQQDSHEFLTFLLDWMHNDLKKVIILPHYN